MNMNLENPYKNDKKDLETAQGMNELSNTIFAPIYPVIARHINEKFNITNGNCIDIGSGPTTLSISLACIKKYNSAVIGQAEKMPFDNKELLKLLFFCKCIILHRYLGSSDKFSIQLYPF